MYIRQAWLDYYRSLGFQAIGSAPLIHAAFPTSFNMSAGLVQLDSRIRQSQPVAPSRECLIQKCVRHYDIGLVGDNSHLSFFEMAGAFEIAEFDETKTIARVWHFLTAILGLSSAKLWVTAFDTDQVVDRTLTLASPLKTYLRETMGEHLVWAQQQTNLWKQGGGIEFRDNFQLCGPQVEFFYDLSDELAQPGVNPLTQPQRFLEVANILLIKYGIDRNAAPTLRDLTNPATEVVIGIERCQQAMENQTDITRTVIFAPLRQLLKGAVDTEVKIVIDHIKSLTHILAEAAVQPSHSARGRIVRTLIRELLASLYILQLNPVQVVPQLVDAVIAFYQDFYPEVKVGREVVVITIAEHEQVYQRALAKVKQHLVKELGAPPLAALTDLEQAELWLRYGVPKKLIPVLYK